MEEITIGELARRVKQLPGSRSEIVHVPYDEAYEEEFGDMLRRVPDLRKIQRLIGYAPTVMINQMLSAVIEFYRDRSS